MRGRDAIAAWCTGRLDRWPRAHERRIITAHGARTHVGHDWARRSRCPDRELAEEGFAPWSEESDEIVQWVLEGLERLSWEPEPGSRAWIRNTAAGDEIGRSLSNSGAWCGSHRP